MASAGTPTACGSRLFNLHADDIEVRIGSLDEAPTTLGAPDREGWVKRREAWLPPVVGAEQSLEDPPASGSPDKQVDEVDARL